jgi:hypothetical protein
MLGYTPKERTLVIEPTEAEAVRFIFQRYLELRSVHQLQADLAAKGVRAKGWITRKGTKAGGGILARGALYHLLRNRHYLGEIVHKGVPHPGQHPAIIDAELFGAVQQRLDEAKRTREQKIRVGRSPLTGLVFDDRGHPMSPAHARGQTGKRHRYYVSTALITGMQQDAGSMARVPARGLEDLIQDRVGRLSKQEFAWERARAVVDRLVVSADRIEITLAGERDAAAVLEQLPVDDKCEARDGKCVITIAVRLGQRGGAVRMLDPSGRRVVDRPEPDPVLIRALAKGWRWREQLLSGAYATSSALAREEGQTQTSLHRFVRLAYLAPDLISEILEGRQRPGLSLNQLCRADLPLDWAAQRRLFSANATR